MYSRFRSPQMPFFMPGNQSLLREALFNSGVLYPQPADVPAEDWQGQHLIPASGKCLSFDGVAAYVSCGNDSSVQLTSSLTISAWVKTDTMVARSIFGRWTITTNFRSFLLTGNTGNLTFFWSTNGTNSASLVGPSFLNDDNWHHVAITYEASTAIKMFVDGKVVASKLSDVPAAIYVAATAPLLIGAHDNGTEWQFSGEIADVAVYATISARFPSRRGTGRSSSLRASPPTSCSLSRRPASSTPSAPTDCRAGAAMASPCG